MPKKKKIKKIKEKVLEDSKEKTLVVQKNNLNDKNLVEQIKKVVEGLYYISETDAEILPYAGERAASVTKEELLIQTKGAGDAQVEEKDYAGFFARMTSVEDWFGDEEKATAQKFVELKKVLESNLRDLKVFKVGKIQLDIYVVGLDADDRLTGIKTKAVET